jgi:S-adenosylmethionine:tRNA ribosyltransferase-isomerase
MVGVISKWKEETLELQVCIYLLKARIIELFREAVLIRFEWDPPHRSFAELLDGVGVLPIPPYLKRGTESIDLERYQTIFAVEKGSVAAPTAGLHFTERVFAQLAAKSIFPTSITLHVGAGTFKPVKADRMEDHSMHAEFIDVERSVLEQLVSSKDHTRVVVGTTSMRTIESLYWLGVKLLKQPDTPPGLLNLEQWEPYELEELGILPMAAMEALLHWMDQHQLDSLVGTTGVLIAPGYRFKLVDALITNFHQPQSTLILLVAALIGEDWRKVYQYALDNDFRFLSYGDGSLLFRH